MTPSIIKTKCIVWLSASLLLTWLAAATVSASASAARAQANGAIALTSEPLEKAPESVEAGRERLTVLAPRRLRPGSDYHILISLARSQVAATVDLTLTGGRDSDREVTDAKSVLAQSGETQTVKFKIGDWPAASYVLNVSAIAIDRSWNFTKEAELQYQAKKFSIIIQTDKSIYKPGEEVKFRAVLLDPKLNPVKLRQEINVTVTDPRRNVVKQWLAESSEAGLVSNSLALSQDPMMGEDWTIKVEAQGQVGVRKFQVAEYILPTFDVQIDLPPFATFNESDIVATVRAAYTYGKPVDGQVTLTVQPKVRYLYLQTRPLDSHQFKAQLDPDSGKADFQLDLVKDLWLERELYGREIEFFALVEEKLTGRKYNRTQTLTIHDKPIRIDLLNADRNFKPGLAHLFQFRIAYQDEKPIEDNGPEMVVRFVEEQQLINMTRLRPSAGLANYWLDIPRFVKRESGLSEQGEPEEGAPSAGPGWLPLNYLDVQVMYRGQVYHVGQVSSQKTKSGEHLSVSLGHLSPPATAAAAAGASRANSKQQLRNKQPPLVNPVISVGEELRVRVEATEPMSLLTCHGMARGDIVWVVTREPRNETRHEFTVKLDQRMTPMARVVCFYVRDETRELIADGLTFPVAGLFRNQLKLSLSSEETKPGKQVEIRALTKPNSLVGLLAVDESVLLLKSANDFSQDELRQETEEYGARFSDSFGLAPTSADRVFKQADVIVLTNNKIFNGWQFESDSDEGDFDSLSGKALYQSNARERIELSMNAAPMSAAPVSFAGPGGRTKAIRSSRNEEPLVIRSQFPETWLWANESAGADGQAIFSARVPDTITSWQLSGFSLHDEFGFGLSSGKTTLRVFRPFFLKLNLPYSIIRGETLNVQCVVFNYGPKATQARVTFDNNLNEFDFIEASNEIEDTNEEQPAAAATSQSRQVQLEPEQGVAVSFLVRPKKLGHLDVRIVARSDTNSDGIVRKLLVKPEGQTQFMNKAVLLNLHQGAPFAHNFSVEVPPNAVPGSQKVFLSAIGDVMGAGLANVDDLLRLPYGCGEQNMINLVPNIVIMNYLTSTRRLKEAQRVRALRNIETGYQRQLNYKRRDGSFSAFGESDKNGSVWLTAYVLKTFQQARGLVKIDPKVVRRAANFIGHFAQSDGSIKEHGMLHDKRLQSASSSSLYLTAYSLIALLQDSAAGKATAEQPPPADFETSATEKPIDEVVQRAIYYLESQLESRASTLTTYELAIVAYALQLAGRQNSFDRAYQLLWAEARDDPKSGGGIWWSNERDFHARKSGEPDRESELEFEKLLDTTPSPSTVQPPLKPIPANAKHSAHLFLPESLSIEMTAFALLATVGRGELDRALPIVKWLIAQQNSNGGFASTQDTVLAIEALATFASAVASSKTAPTSIDIEIVYPRPTSNGTNSANRSRSSSANLLRRNNVEQLLISSSNELVNQQLRLTSNNNKNDDDESIKWVHVQATGVGAGVIQVSWQYNLLVSAEQPAFYLNPYVDRASNINYLQLSVCTYYKQSGDSSNMAVVDVELPSGYLVDLDALPSLRRTREVKRIDTTEGDTRVLVYLDRVTNEELCFTVPAHRGAKVSNNKPVPVTIYDYYDRHKAARIFYEPIPANTCDICDSGSCSKACQSGQQAPSNSFRSLHDQRKQSTGKSSDKLREESPPNSSATGGNQFSKLLPLAPVVMTLISLFN